MTYGEYHVNEFSIAIEIALPSDPDGRPAYPIPAGNRIILRRASLADLPSTLRKIRRQLVYDVGDGLLIEPNGLALHMGSAHETEKIGIFRNFDTAGELVERIACG